ncbi:MULTISPECIES: hypothetical protein [Oceanibaculum]|uniref:Uncharacterized protein n=2 Tax=Oceanibaculum indicum TaxID=526216 RepID=K2KGB8_9PROT|nr:MULTISPECIES: hypothetical protein [Oceanibaculum]EKE76385.1 hypothetical protein P24_08559 [Oceanibaculum indicum P24]MCH2393882.1 hypothetical protein [Oceanibaculum sp.]RKQ73410.1 hypothetical protein BCL74_1198 [Oceanibaculum indicum]
MNALLMLGLAVLLLASFVFFSRYLKQLSLRPNGKVLGTGGQGTVGDASWFEMLVIGDLILLISALIFGIKGTMALF